MSDDMRKRVAGYVPETRGGRTLHRVRVEGQKRKRVTIPVGPDHPDFWPHYYAARAGRELPAPAKTGKPPGKTLRKMVDGYLDWLKRQAEAGNMSLMTWRQRRSLLLRVCDMPDDGGARTMGEYSPDMPPAAMLHIQDQWGAKTAQADASMKALRAAYRWGIPRGWAPADPASAVVNVHSEKGGAVPWTSEDMAQFLARHPEGTMPRLWLLLAAFTGARLEDLSRLGRRHEVQRAGMTWLEWHPAKKGSAPVSLPMAPQLFEATRAMPVVGQAYLLLPSGRPWAGAPSLGNYVRRWTTAAGLERRSSHGLRKALGGLLATAGASEHQIMAVLAHTSPKTAAKYTRSANRAGMAAAAMAAIAGLRIG